jgi:hypothetical protein
LQGRRGAEATQLAHRPSLTAPGEPPAELIERLRDRDNYQGARYELVIGAIFARLDCTIR